MFFVDDLHFVKQGTSVKPTGSGTTEVHILSAATGYSAFDLQTKTALGMTGEENWTFALAGNGDLYAVNRGGAARPTGSGTTEVHILSKEGNYQNFSLRTKTALEMTGDDPWAFAVGANGDLFAIKRGSAAKPTGSGTTEVHVLDAASSFQSFKLQTKTALEMTGDDPWAFAVGANGDLFAIKRGSAAKPTDSGTTEVHILDAASSFQSFKLQTKTALEMTGDDPWAFAVDFSGFSRNLFAIKSGSAAKPTGSGTTELHILSGDSDYQDFSLQAKTALEMTGDDSWAFAGLFPYVGYAFLNSWEFDDIERATVRNILAEALAASFAILVPLVVPLVAPAIGLADALGALIGIPPGTLEIAGGAIAIDKIKGTIDTTLMSAYGLCGGMAWSALDYLLAGKPIPPKITSAPIRPQGAVQRDFIWKRHLDTMAAGVATTTIEWIAIMKIGLLGGAEEILRRTASEWNALKAHIDAGTPWPIVVIGTAASPLNDHQVLVLGYSDFGNGTGKLHIYDPNRPGQVALWSLDFRGKTLVADEGISAESDRGPLQGFFCSSYVPDPQPPDV